MSARSLISSKFHTYIFDSLMLISIFGLLFFLFLDSYPLIIPDEGNYAEIAREMWVSKNYITPTLNEIKFFEKPILLYWLGIFFSKIFGFSLWSLRTCHAVMGIFMCLATYAISRYFYNRLTGIFAALILGSSGLYFILAHMYTTDMTVTFFLTLTFYSFWLSVNISSKKFTNIFLVVAAFFAGCAVLAKGLIGIILPVFICMTWILVAKQWRILKNTSLLIASIIFFVTVVPWHALITFENPEFLHFYFVEHHLARFKSGSVGHLQPFWYYGPVLLLGFFPWIAFLFQALVENVKQCMSKSKHALFLACWSLGILVFFTISKAKLIPYILPAFPPLAIMVGNYLSQHLKKPTMGMRIGYQVLSAGMIILAMGFWLFPIYWPVNHQIVATFYLHLCSFILIIGGLIAIFIYKRQAIKAFFVISLTSSLVNLSLILALPSLDTLNISALTKILTPVLKQEDIVVAFNHHYQDLAFYLNRRIMILNSRKLFAFGMAHQAQHDWMIDDKTFNTLWKSEKRVFAVMDKKDFTHLDPVYLDLEFHVLGENKRNVLVSNKL